MNSGQPTPGDAVTLINGQVNALAAAKSAMVQRMKSASAGFFTVPDRGTDLRAAERLAKTVSKRAKTLVVLGIGGSDLGARAIIRACGVSGKGMDVRFLESGADPDELASLLTTIDLNKTALNVVSKSGDTMEPLANFLILREKLVKAVGAKRAAERIVVTTDPEKGALREIAHREGYATLDVPTDVGGRWCALTSVGLFPAACARVPVRKLLAGAAAVRDAWLATDATEDSAMAFAALHHHLSTAQNRRVTVLMPYQSVLRDFALWFRQLWAESLGKDGQGFTPVAALGPADQHSQLQLWNDGPHDAVITLLSVARPRADFKVPRAYADLAAVKRLGGHRLGAISRIGFEATMKTLASHGRPHGILEIPAITPESVGGLMMHFMIATAGTAQLMGIDAYDQPGVEEGKRFIREALER